MAAEDLQDLHQGRDQHLFLLQKCTVYMNLSWIGWIVSEHHQPYDL